MSNWWIRHCDPHLRVLLDGQDWPMSHATGDGTCSATAARDRSTTGRLDPPGTPDPLNRDERSTMYVTCAAHGRRLARTDLPSITNSSASTMTGPTAWVPAGRDDYLALVVRDETRVLWPDISAGESSNSPRH
ncbi:hypothetical protein GS942_21490 [Rhodococcus hoagii]|nr:hypothetical protein [Prescottella equi]